MRMKRTKVFSRMVLFFGLLSLMFFYFQSPVFAEQSYQYVTEWGSQGSGDGQFEDPTGVAVDSSGNVYVADGNNNINHRIQKFDSDGNYLTQWGSEGAGNGQFIRPLGVAVDSLDNVYVVDYDNDRVQKFDSNGTYITQWGSTGSGNGEFNHLKGVAVDSSDNIYVVDAFNLRIQKFDSSGAYITQWGGFGSGEGQFDQPYGIAVDSSDNVYVVEANTSNDRVQKFDSNGTFLAQWDSLAWGPKGIAADSSGNVYVSDYGGHCIEIFDSNGAYLAQVGGGYGTGAGQFDQPMGIAIDSTDNMYVADGDRNNHRVQKFTAPPEWAAAYPKVGAVAVTSAEILLKTNKAGNAYFVALPSGASAPTAAQVKSGQDSTGAAVAASLKGSTALAANTEAGITATSLTGNTTYDLYVVAEGSAGLLQANPTKVTVTTLNGAPTDINLDNSSVSENQSSGVLVGTLNATDSDSVDTAAFTLVSGIGDTDNGSFTIEGTNLKTAEIFDYETKNSYSIRIRVTDGGSNTYEKPLTISITDENEAPAVSDQNFSIDENSSNGTAVGIIPASDVDAGQALTYSITGGNLGNAFAINAGTGEIAVNDGSVLDYESYDIIMSGYTLSLTVQVTDDGIGSLSDSATITVNINDINEVPVVGDQSFSLDENSSNGTNVGTIAASDVDAGQIISYSITSGNLGNTFAINTFSGQITINDENNLDYETTAVYSLTVAVTDDGIGTLSDSATVTLDINDVNEAPVMSDKSFSIDENTSNGTSIGIMAASDVDAGQTLSYSITGGNVGNAFAINTATGEITVNAESALDYENVTSFLLTVQVIDDGTVPLSNSAAVTVDLNDIVEAPVVNDQSFSIDENSSIGTSIGIVVASDIGQALIYSITDGNNGNVFAIDTSSGELTVNEVSTLNYEGSTGYTLTVKVADEATGTLSDSATITIDVNDINEAPITQDQSFSIDENSSNGTSVGTVTASDVDAGQIIGYSITGGNTGNAFAIDAATGEITVNEESTLDYESVTNFSLTVEAKDNFISPLSDSATITIAINNIIDSDSESVSLDKTALEITFSSGDNTASVTQDVNLPGSGDNGTTITWSSSNTGIISNTGAVARPAYYQGDAAVTLTATIAKGSESETREFNLTVLKLAALPSSSGSSDPITTNDTTGELEIIIGGETEGQAATVETEQIGNKNVVTISLVTEKILEGIPENESSSTVLIPASDKEANIFRGELTGELVKGMEEKKAIIEMQTEKASYSLSAKEIKIEKLAKEMGEIELADIKISIQISEASDKDIKTAEKAAADRNIELVVAPVSFEVKASHGDKEIEIDRFDNYVGRMITIPENVDLAKITTGVLVSPDGTLSHIPTQVKIVDGRAFVKINSLTNSTYSVIRNPREFADVGNHWSGEAVNDMASRLVISGYGQDTFKPDKDITRAEFSTIVVRALGLREPMVELPFSDVSKDAWYYEAVQLAYEYGIVSGYKDGTFKPGKKITREEAMAMVAKAMTVAQLDTELKAEEVTGELAKFTDNSQIAGWAKELSAACVNKGIVGGYDGKITPKNNITRAETAVMARNVLEKAGLI